MTEPALTVRQRRIFAWRMSRWDAERLACEECRAAAADGSWQVAGEGLRWLCRGCASVVG